MDLDKFFEAVAIQEDTEQFLFRLTPAERAALGKLASTYKMPMAQVLKRLLRQAVVDYYQDNEVWGLIKYQ